MPNEAVVSLIPRIFNVLSHVKYSALIESETSEEFINNLINFRIIEKTSEKIGDIVLEKELNSSIYRRARKFVTGNPFNIGVLLGFVIMNIINVKNITTILESKKIRYENEKLAKMLIY
jgi:vacuolar-type H+-ATPase subunit C/Vma6